MYMQREPGIFSHVSIMQLKKEQSFRQEGQCLTSCSTVCSMLGVYDICPPIARYAL